MSDSLTIIGASKHYTKACMAPINELSTELSTGQMNSQMSKWNSIQECLSVWYGLSMSLLSHEPLSAAIVCAIFAYYESGVVKQAAIIAPHES